MQRYIVGLATLLLVVIHVAATRDIQIMSEIAYMENGNEQQVLDVYLPADATSPYATIFMVHGGGFIMGDKSEMAHVARHYADLGYAVVNVNYRLAPQVTFPSAHEDVFCAMAWTFAHADEYHFDLDRLILLGESAGANIVAYLATVDDTTDFTSHCAVDYPENPHFRAAITFYLPVDLLTCTCDMARRMASLYTSISYFDWDNEATQAAYQDRSFVASLDANDPTFYMIHGENDFLVPVSESEFFVDAYQAVGGQAELVIIKGANHGFLTNGVPVEHLNRAYELVDGWLLEIFDVGSR